MNLKVIELVSLNHEVFGLINQATNEIVVEGLLKTVANQKLKMIVHRLGKVTSEETKTYEELRKALYLKYGEEKDGMVEIQEKGKQEFIKELTELEALDKEIDTKSLWGDTDVQALLEKENTSEYYPVFYKLIGV